MPQPGVFDKQVKPRPAQGAGGAFNQFPFTVAASQTIRANDVVDISSGVVQQAISLPGSNNSATLSGGNLSTLGIALGSITTNSSGIDTSTGFNVTTLPVAIWDGNLEVLMRAWNATASNTTIGNFTVGSNYQLGRWRGANSGTWWYFISTTTTNGELQVVEPYGVNDQQSTDQYALMFVKAIISLRQF